MTSFAKNPVYTTHLHQRIIRIHLVLFTYIYFNIKIFLINMRDYVHKAPDYVDLFAYKVISTLEKSTTV